MFWGYSKWQQIKHSTSILNRSLSSNFYWLRSANNVKFTEEYLWCMEKPVVVKEIFTNSFVTQSLSWKCSPTLPKRKNIQVQQSVKKVMLTVFGDMKGPITIDFLEKDVTINSTSNCQNSPYLLNDGLLRPISQTIQVRQTRCDCVTLIGELRLTLSLTCIYRRGQVHYVGSTTYKFVESWINQILKTSLKAWYFILLFHF